MGTGHVKTFRSQKYKIKTTKPVPLFSHVGGTEFFECLNQFSRILNQGTSAPTLNNHQKKLHATRGTRTGSGLKIL